MDSSEEEKPGFCLSTIGDHAKRTQSSRRHLFVRSWVEDQRQESVHSQSCTEEVCDEVSLPVIIVTNVDQEESLPIYLNSTGQSRSGVVKNKPANFPLHLGAKMVSIFPSMIDEPILEEDGDEQDNKAEGCCTQTPSMIHANEVGEESLSLSTFDRKRAKSYPSEKTSEPILLLELSKQPKEEENQTNIKSTSHGITKFAHVAVLAKKWKKRSSQEEGYLGQQAKGSIAGRQKKRQYVEIPRALKLDIYEEAVPLVQKTYQMYKSCLGLNHKLTLVTEQHLQSLSIQLGKTTQGKGRISS